MLLSAKHDYMIKQTRTASLSLFSCEPRILPTTPIIPYTGLSCFFFMDSGSHLMPSYFSRIPGIKR
jgi:hypothetical protein